MNLVNLLYASLALAVIDNDRNGNGRPTFSWLGESKRMNLVDLLYVSLALAVIGRDGAFAFDGLAIWSGHVQRWWLIPVERVGTSWHAVLDCATLARPDQVAYRELDYDSGVVASAFAFGPGAGLRYWTTTPPPRHFR